MDGEGLTTSEKVDKLGTDFAVLAATTIEMGKRQDDMARSIDTLNHNSTAMQVNIAKLEASIDKNTTLIESLKKDLSSNFKIWLTVLGLALTTIMFIINYFKP